MTKSEAKRLRLILEDELDVRAALGLFLGKKTRRAFKPMKQQRLAKKKATREEQNAEPVVRSAHICVCGEIWIPEGFAYASRTDEVRSLRRFHSRARCYSESIATPAALPEEVPATAHVPGQPVRPEHISHNHTGRYCSLCAPALPEEVVCDIHDGDHRERLLCVNPRPAHPPADPPEQSNADTLAEMQQDFYEAAHPPAARTEQGKQPGEEGNCCICGKPRPDCRRESLAAGRIKSAAAPMVFCSWVDGHGYQPHRQSDNCIDPEPAPGKCGCHLEAGDSECMVHGADECGTCGAKWAIDSTWRWNGKGWEHKCPGLPAQAGHFAAAPHARSATPELAPNVVPCTDCTKGQCNYHRLYPVDEPVTCEDCLDPDGGPHERQMFGCKPPPAPSATLEPKLKCSCGPEIGDSECFVHGADECGTCGAKWAIDSTWRWNGKGWEHKCPGLPAQAGHFAAKPKAPTPEPEKLGEDEGNCVICGKPRGECRRESLATFRQPGSEVFPLLDLAVSLDPSALDEPRAAPSPTPNTRKER